MSRQTTPSVVFALANFDSGTADDAIQLSQVIDTMPSLLWSAGPDGELTQINQWGLDYSGMRFEDFLHLGWYKFHHPDDLANTANAFSHAIQTGTSYRALSRLRRADGEYRWHHESAEPLRDRHGRIVHWYGVSVDIDEGKRAEDRLRRSEAYLAEAQRLSHTGSFGWTPSTGELHWSDETFRILEYDPSIKPTIERVLQRVHPNERGMIRQVIDETSSGEKDFDIAHRLLMPDGSVKFVHVLSHALKDAAGNLEVVGALMDVSENTLLYSDLAEREARLVERTAALLRSEAHLAEAQRLSHTGSAVYNETMILYWSDETYRIFEFDPLKGPPSREAMLQRFHPDDQVRALEEARRAVRQKKDYRLEYRAVLPSGTIKHIELTAHPKFSASGELVEVVSTLIDVTERKRAEEALRESEYNLRQIAETVPGLIWSNGPDGEPTHINQRMLDYSGMLFEDFKRRGWEAFVHPADYPETEKAFFHAIQAGTSYEGVMRLRRADGEFRWHHARCEPLRDRQGRVVQWYGLCFDIDEGKQAEDLLRRSEGHLAEAQRLSHTGAVAYNGTAILYASEETYRIWGFDPAQGVPSRETVFQRIHPGDRDRLDAEVRRAAFEKRKFSVGYRIVLPDGTVKHLDTIGQPVFSASGELVQIVATQTDVTERKRAEEGLRESEVKFRDYAETASDWFCEMGPDYKFTMLSENAFGSGAVDRIGTACWDHALDLETEPEKWRLLWETIGSRKPFRDFVYHGMSGYGSPMYVRASGKPVFDANGEFRGYRGACTDVTEIMRAQEALRESERSARSAIDGIAGLLAIMAPNGEVETVNRPCLEYFGRSLEWLKNWGTNDAVHLEDLPRVLELFKGAMASEIPFNFEQRLRRFDGEYRWFDNRGVPVRDASGRIAHWYILLTDIEDRKRAEHASRSAIDAIAGLVAILAPNGEVETVNRPLFEYFGRSLEELKNWGTSDAVHPEDLPRVLELNKRGLASGLRFNFELRLRRFDGEYRLFDTRVVPIRDDSGRIERWYNLLMDIEDRSRALARLEQMRSDFAHMNRVSMMGELAASLSHEITQPIASAHNYARAALNFLDRQRPDLGEVKKQLSGIVGAADRARDIIDRIRDHIKKAPPRKCRFDLNKAIDEVIGLARSAITTNAVSVRTGLAEGLFPVEGDRVQLQQVALNLILNAVEAMSTVEAGPREMSISTEQHEAGGVLMTVRDSGPGIDPDHLDRVFQAFYTTKSSGVGMGLSICRSIIDAHGGRLWADTNASRGAVFRFTLPGACRELANSRHPAHLTGRLHEDTV